MFINLKSARISFQHRSSKIFQKLPVRNGRRSLLIVWCSIWYITLLLAPHPPYSRKMRWTLIQSGDFLGNYLAISVSIFDPWEIHITFCYGSIWFSFIWVQSVSQFQIHFFSHMVVISGWYSFSPVINLFWLSNFGFKFLQILWMKMKIWIWKHLT